MRCKVGDLVVIVRDDDFPQNIGRLGRIVGAPVPEEFWHPCGEDWAVEPATTFWGWGESAPVDNEDTTAFFDADLRPIRDPGPDAVDETLSSLDITPHPGLVFDRETA